MNSQMRRIDLICKLLGPFVIAMIDGVSTEVAILVNFGMNVASVPLEYYFIAQVCITFPRLARDILMNIRSTTKSQSSSVLEDLDMLMRVKVMT